MIGCSKNINTANMLINCFLFSSTICIGILIFLIGVKEKVKSTDEQVLIKQVENTLNVEGAIIIHKMDTVYKIKIEKNTYDVYLKDDVDSEILLIINKSSTLIFDNE